MTVSLTISNLTAKKHFPNNNLPTLNDNFLKKTSEYLKNNESTTNLKKNKQERIEHYVENDSEACYLLFGDKKLSKRSIASKKDKATIASPK